MPDVGYISSARTVPMVERWALDKTGLACCRLPGEAVLQTGAAFASSLGRARWSSPWRKLAI